ncbi:MAG: hypothetical protein AB2690_16720 [Candidatus Thiodiazotropha endolucinida]
MRFGSGWRGLDMRSRQFLTGELIKAGALEIGDGYRAKNSELSNDGLPFARAGNIQDGFQFDGADRFPIDELKRVGRKVSLPGDVVFTSKGTVGRFAFVGPETEQFVYSPQLCFWRSIDVDVIDPRYLFFWMRGSEFANQVDYLQHQTDMAAYVSLKDQRQMRMSLPEIDVQRDIARTLGSIDDKIANNRVLAADLETMARTIFKSWFVDFDPVKAKMEGRAPAGMDADTAAMFPDTLVESELGVIPEGWKFGTLASKSDLNPESWTARNHPDSILYADLAGTDRGQIVETKAFDWADAPSRARRVLRPGDTIVGTVRPGNRAYSYVGVDDLTGSTGFAVLRPHAPSLRSFIYHAATADEAIDRLANLADGAAYPAVRPDVVAATPVVVAPDSVIDGFAKITQPLLDWMVASHAENTKLAQLRDTLLPRLISGKLPLPVAPPEAEPPTKRTS